MKLDEATIERIRVKLAEVCPELPVRLVVLFGSQADGRARPDSDVDIGVWFIGDTDYEALGEIRAIAEVVAGDREVDCIPLRWDAPTLVLNVALSCIPLYYRTERDFIDFLLTAHRVYDDHAGWRRAMKEFVDAWLARRGYGLHTADTG